MLMLVLHLIRSCSSEFLQNEAEYPTVRGEEERKESEEAALVAGHSLDDACCYLEKKNLHFL